MRRCATLVSAASIILACVHPDPNIATQVPLARLIANGAQFNHQVIMASGFAGAGAAFDHGLYLNEEAARYGMLSFGVALDLTSLTHDPERLRETKSRLTNNWVTIRATFTHFPGADTTGALTNIEAVVVHGPALSHQ